MRGEQRQGQCCRTHRWGWRYSRDLTRNRIKTDREGGTLSVGAYMGMPPVSCGIRPLRAPTSQGSPRTSGRSTVRTPEPEVRLAPSRAQHATTPVVRTAVPRHLPSFLALPLSRTRHRVNGGPCGPSHATGASPALEPAATYPGWVPIRTNGQAKSPGSPNGGGITWMSCAPYLTTLFVRALSSGSHCQLTPVVESGW